MKQAEKFKNGCFSLDVLHMKVLQFDYPSQAYHIFIKIAFYFWGYETLLFVVILEK